jgi:LmbE family N-acetylglucosaminyl deacetylase
LDYPLKVIVIAAHPDEAEMYAGGTVRLLADRGAAVKFMSLTNGDAGHHEMERVPLKRRRAREAYAAARHLGVLDYEILDIHDGELVPDLALRQRVISAICRWQADVVVSFHADCPGHLDNRAAGHVVRDAVGFCGNANIVGDLPALARAPLCLKMTDYGAVPTHRHDIVIDNDPSIDAKLHACTDHATQFYEFAPYERGFLGEVPTNGSWADQRAFILKHWPEFMYALDAMRPGLIDSYGERGKSVQFAESFQLADYGRPASAAEAHKLLAS